MTSKPPPPSSSPPPQPAYIFRGHSAHITAIRFAKQNTRLLTADANGWLTVWNLSTKRPTIVWKAHDQAILGIETWHEDCYLTHGREQKVIVWQLTANAESDYSTLLPAERPDEYRKQPWILHSLEARGSGFCPFAVCTDYCLSGERDDDGQTPLLVAVPGGENIVDILSLPSEGTLHKVCSPKQIKTGMIMTMKIAQKEGTLILCTGYESGYTIVQTLELGMNKWITTYTANPHSQPVLSIDTSPNLENYFTSAADSVIAKHPLLTGQEKGKASARFAADSCLMQVTTKHAGQQLVRVRSDGQILATAGWDGRIRVYSAQNLKELAVLVWHKQGCYAVDFANVACSNISLEGENIQKKEVLPLVGRSLLRPVERREIETRSKHWLAAGSKDGKVSLWEIY